MGKIRHKAVPRFQKKGHHADFRNRGNQQARQRLATFLIHLKGKPRECPERTSSDTPAGLSTLPSAEMSSPTVVSASETTRGQAHINLEAYLVGILIANIVPGNRADSDPLVRPGGFLSPSSRTRSGSVRCSKSCLWIGTAGGGAPFPT